MATRNTLEVLKQCFEEVVPRHDKRTTIAPLSFVVCLVYTYLERVAEFPGRSLPLDEPLVMSFPLAPPRWSFRLAPS